MKAGYLSRDDLSISGGAERFWSNVEKLESGCWRWTRNYHPNGYGRAAVKQGGRWLLRWAHRVAYVLAHGEIPEGLCVLHACDHPYCVNPSHLRLGTPTENVRDRELRGRTARGEQSGSLNSIPWTAKLSPEQVRECRSRFAQGGVTQEEMARTYGVSDSAMSCLLNGKTWRWVK